MSIELLNPNVTPNRFIPIDSEEQTALELIGKLTGKMNEVTTTTNDVVMKWESVMEWLKNNGLKNEVIEYFKTLIDGGFFNQAIEEIVARSPYVVPAFFKKDTDTDDTNSLQTAIDYAKENGKYVELEKKTYTISKTLIIYANTKIVGKGYKHSVIKKCDGFIGNHMETYDFHNQKGKPMLSDTVNPNLAKDFRLEGFTLDGNYMENDFHSVNNKYNCIVGGGLFVYGRLYTLDIHIVNQAGIGFYSECIGPEVEMRDYKNSSVKLNVSNTRQECIVFRGPSDIKINEVYASGGGAKIKDEQEGSPMLSDLYANEPVNNIVFEAQNGYSGACEVGFIHSYGCFNGKGMKIYGGRLNADLIICESCRGGGFESIETYGTINNLKVHNVGGFSWSSECVKIYTLKGLTVSSLFFEKGVGKTFQTNTCVDVRGYGVQIPSLYINGYGVGGHGLYVTGNGHRISGLIHNLGDVVLSDGYKSTGFIRESTGANNVFNIEVDVINAPNGIRFIGTNNLEKIKSILSLKTGGAYVLGDIATSIGNSRGYDLKGYGVNGGVTQTTRNVVEFTIDPTVTTEQSVEVPLNNMLDLYTPQVMARWRSTQATGARMDYMFVESITNGIAKVVYKFAVSGNPSGVKGIVEFG